MQYLYHQNKYQKFLLLELHHHKLSLQNQIPTSYHPHQSKTQANFYRRVAAFTREFLVLEREAFAML